jgi:uncharacterized membrane protein HdeD (DUF308 family)
MVHLALLLIGAKALQPHWRTLVALGVFCMAFGAVLVADVWNGVDIFTIDVVGAVLFFYGLIDLGAALFIGARRSSAAIVRGLVFMVCGFLAYNFPADRNLGATVILGTAFALDGALRILTAVTVRFHTWRWALAGAIGELILAVLVFADWPLHHHLTAPFCLGLAVAMTGLAFFRIGRQLRHLPPGASVTALPLFSHLNWHARTPLPNPDSAAPWSHAAPLTVYVWTPTGSALDPLRRPLVDRYVAAVDRKGVISTGHSALDCPPELYVSHYPGVEIDHSPTDFTHMLRATSENDIRGRFLPSHEAEVADWCPPDRHIEFHRYNRNALRQFWSDYSRDDTYNLTRRNCSSTVVMALDAAIEGVFSHERPGPRLLRLFLDPNMYLLALLRGRAESMTWTPGLVLDYAARLQAVTQRASKAA